MSEQAGTFIAFEGGDSAGKSTQVRQLAATLEAVGREVVITRQPGGTALGSALRDLVLHGQAVTPRAEALIFAADKAQHVQEVILPSLARGAVVITDRYTDSSVAYQGAGRSLGAQEVADLQAWAVGGLTPDLTVLIDVDPAEGRRRRGGSHDRMESEDDTFHHAVRQHFLTMAQAAPQRYLVVDGCAAARDIARQVRTRLTADGVL